MQKAQYSAPQMITLFITIIFQLIQLQISRPQSDYKLGQNYRLKFVDQIFRKSGEITEIVSTNFHIKLRQVYYLNHQQIGHRMSNSDVEANKVSLITENETDSLNRVAEQRERPKRPFIARAFSKMERGSMRGMMFALMASAMGTGIFNLPLRCDEIGLIAFIIYNAASCFFSFMGMYYITMVRVRLQVESYGEMTEKALGTVVKRVAEFCLILYPWGITVCFQVIFAKFVLQLLNDVCGMHLYEDRRNEIYNDTGNYMRIGVNIAGILVNMVFILKKDMGILQKIAMVGVFAVVFNTVVIILTSMTGFTRKVTQESGKQIQLIYHGIFHLPAGLEINWFAMNGWSDVSRHFQGLASLIFCYVNHQLLFPLSSQLARPTKKRFFKIFRRVNAGEGTIYMLVGVSSYLLLLEHDKTYPIEAMVLTSIPTSFIAVGKLLMIVSLFFAVPLNLFPCRTIFYEAFNIERSNRNHIILSVCLAFSGCLIAITFQKVNAYFGLLGGTAGVLMAGGIPALCFIKARSNLNAKDIIGLIFAGIIVVIGFTGAILSVVDPA